MKFPFAPAATPLWVEFRSLSFHARTRDAGVDLPVERDSNGRLVPASIDQITIALRGLLGGKSWLSPIQFHVALGCRGMILRPLWLPAAPASEVPRLLQLHIEGEFPLSPEALAWGWMPLPTSAAEGTASGRQEVLVAAIRKEIADEHAAVLQSISSDIRFTPAALARAALAPGFPCAVLDVGSTQSELTLQAAGAAPTVRALPWGENQLIECLSSRFGQRFDEASNAWATLKTSAVDSTDPAWVQAIQDAMVRLCATLPASTFRVPLWISGPPHVASFLVRALGARWESGEPPRVLTVPVGAGYTAATAGMARTASVPAGSSSALLRLGAVPADASDSITRRLPRRSLAVAAALLIAVWSVPYLEALIFKPGLSRRLAALKSGEAQLATIDREFSFLRYLEQNQAPHLDAAFVVAQAAPSGARVETLSINRQGEVALSGFLRDLAQVGEFRLKLVNSGFFSTVVVEDQSPTPDRQRINFRINARWKDVAEREALTLGPTLPEPGVGKSSGTNLATVSPTPPLRPPGAGGPVPQ